jgi:hypothetical protein
MEFAPSLLVEGLANFKREEAIELLEQASGHLEAALVHYKEDRSEAACGQLVKASALWTHATWKEFLEEDVVKSSVPGAYRPLEEE